MAPVLAPPRMADRVEPIFLPDSIAVIGASRHKGKVGYAILRNLLVNEFQGKLFPVNPNADSVQGIKAYPNIGAVPDPVDLAIITVPADLALEAAEECGKKGVRGLVVITAGFREIGGVGEERERRLREIVKRHGIVLVGPNCMGVINTHPDVQMDATFAPTPPLRGHISFLSQSGALGVAILDHARNLKLGFAKFASLGNKADVSGNDLLVSWEDDPETKVILMYLENFGNPMAVAAATAASSSPHIRVGAVGTPYARSRSIASASRRRDRPSAFAAAMIRFARVRSTSNRGNVPSSRSRYSLWRCITARVRAALSGNRYDGIEFVTSSTNPGASSLRPRKLQRTGFREPFAASTIARATSTSSVTIGGT